MDNVLGDLVELDRGMDTLLKEWETRGGGGSSGRVAGDCHSACLSEFHRSAVDKLSKLKLDSKAAQV